MSLTKQSIEFPAQQDLGHPAAAGKKAADAGHVQPVCIEVPITVQGVRPANDAGKREPFTESTKTLIVFANGAVLRIETAVNPGQLIFLTNAHTKKEVVCQVVKSKTYQNVAGYIELEFTEPNPGFWGISFPGEPLEPQAPGPLPARPDAASGNVQFHSAPAIPADVPRTPLPPRKETSHSEEHPSAADPLTAYPELIRPASAGSPRGSGSPGISEPLVFSGSKRSTRPAASTAAAYVDEHVEPAASTRSVFEEALDEELHEPTPRRMPVGALIAAGLILAVVGGGGYWWRSSRHSSAANSSTHPANAAGLVAPPANAQTVSELSSPSPSSSGAQGSDASKTLTASGQLSVPGPVQPVSSSSASRPVEKPAENLEAATQPGKKPALSRFRLSTPSAARPALRGPNLGPAQGVEPAPAVPGAASPEGIGGLVGSASFQPAAPKPDAPSGGELKQARLVSSAPPTYPPLARSQRVEGDVTLDALIDATGRVTTIKVISGPVLLQQAAAAAVRLWRYEPATLNGSPVPMHLLVTVKFRLR